MTDYQNLFTQIQVRGHVDYGVDLPKEDTTEQFEVPKGP